MGRLVIFLFLLNSNLFGDIDGIVLNRDENIPLSNVNITVKEKAVGTATDKNGEFSLHYDKKGTLILIVSRIGYRKKEVELINPSTSVKIYLEQQPIPAKGITVYGKRIYEKKSGETISSDEINRIPFIKPDPIISLKSFAGVSSLTDYLGIIYVRGGGGDENLFLLDDIELPYLFHFSGFETIVNPMIVKEVTFEPGGFSSIYGNRLSSVISVKSRDLSGKSNFRFRTDPTEIAAFYEASLQNNLNYRLSMRRGILNIYLKRAFGNYQNLFVPYFGDFEQKIMYNYMNGNISFSLLRSKDGVQISVPLENQDEKDTVSLDWENLINLYTFKIIDSTSSAGRIELNFTHINSHNKFETKHLGKMYTNEKDAERTFNFSLRKRISTSHFIHSGFSYKDIQKNDRTCSGLDYYTDLPYTELYANTTTTQLTVFIEDSYTMTEKINLRTGIRWDNLQLTKEKTISPRIQLIYNPLNPLKFYLYWGYFRQFPSFYFLSNNDYFPNSQRLTSAKAYHYIGGVKINFSSNLQLSVEPYHKEFESLICYDSTGFNNLGWGYAHGIDIVLRKKSQNGSFGWITYSYCVSKRKIMDFDDLYTYKSEEKNILNIVFSQPLIWKSRCGVRYRFNTGIPVTPFYGRYYIPHSDTLEEGDWGIIWGIPNSRNLPSYSRLDIRIDKEFSLSNFHINIFFCCLNVYNKRNIYDWIYIDARQYYIPIYMLPIVPFVGIEGRF